ncbi:MAG: hypothetical protein PHH86_03835 [Sphaerochaetaceae bacterium]|jgi:hypothetical protein|nr:hypothetical protein [Sphaerochaetaceae bacterium]
MEKKIMKRIILGVAILTLIFVSTSCATMLAGMLGLEVDPPESVESSLLFVELRAYTWNQSGERDDDVLDLNYTSGFYPIVINQYGNEVAFDHIEGLTDAGIIFHSANLPAGNYTLKGFRYLWMTRYNFLNSPIKDLKFDGQRKDQWIEIQEYPLPTPIEIVVQPGTVHSLGSYKVYFELRDYDYVRDDNLVRQDDDYKMVKWEYEEINPKDTLILNMMQKWTYKPWQLWNQRNPLAK